MADDIAALVEHLELDKPDIVGYSLGGGVALQTAVKYPARVRKLVVVAANLRPDAIDPAILAQQGQVNAAAVDFMKETPMYRGVPARRPATAGFPALARQDGPVDGKAL